MTTKTKTPAAKKTTTKKATKAVAIDAQGNVPAAKPAAPSLADVISGKGDAVAKAIAAKLAEVPASQPKIRLVTSETASAPDKAEKKAGKGKSKTQVAAAKADKAEKKAGKKASKAKAEEKVKAPSSGARIRELLAEGKDAEAILAIVHKEFPDSKATKGDVAWNKWKMKQG